MGGPMVRPRNRKPNARRSSLWPDRCAGPTVALLLGLLLVGVSGAAAQNQVSNWLNPVSGNWFDAGNWSTNPTAPNGSTFDAVIAATGSKYTVTINGSPTIHSLTLNSANATLSLGSGTTSLL